MQGHETERVRSSGGDSWIVDCAWCGSTFEARREDASFCSARCRMANSREATNRVKWCERTQAQGRMIDSYVRGRDRLYDPQVYAAVLALKNELEFTLSRFEFLRDV